MDTTSSETQSGGETRVSHITCPLCEATCGLSVEVTNDRVVAVRPDPPAVKTPGWVRNPIDNFVLARLEKEGLHPSPPAEKHLLIRRVSLNLTGLPPTPAEVAEWAGRAQPLQPSYGCRHEDRRQIHADGAHDQSGRRLVAATHQHRAVRWIRAQ